MNDLHRAKRKDNGEWIEGYLVKAKWYLDNAEMFVIVPTDVCFFPHCEISEWYEVISETICRYSGLTDKNGNKIWDNDIVKQSFYKILGNEFEAEEISGCEIGVVVTIPTKGTCMKNPFQYVEVNGEVEKNFKKTKMYKGVCQYRCEVIGNIFDNPELLEEINNHD